MPEQAEPGTETVLGRSYQGKGVAPIRAALQDLALRPETARHIAWKLAVHFISDTPDEALVAAMTRAYADSGGALLAVYAAMLDHPTAWVPTLQKVRQPYDFMVAALRSLGVNGAGIMRFDRRSFARLILRDMALMGQNGASPADRTAGPRPAITGSRRRAWLRASAGRWRFRDALSPPCQTPPKWRAGRLGLRRRSR